MTSNTPATSQPNSSLNRDQAVAVAAQQLGLRHYDPANVSAQRVRIGTQSLPFLHDRWIGSETWRIEFGNLDLAKAVGKPALENPYVTHLVVLLSPQTGNVLKVTSRWPAGVPPIAAYPTVAEEERQMRAAKVMFVNVPNDLPRIPLFDAVANDTIVYWSRNVKQVHACYVSEDSVEFHNRPVWSIQFRGFPPFEPFGGGRGHGIPEDARNHYRNVVDAQTGQWLYADTTPQPLPNLDERY